MKKLLKISVFVLSLFIVTAYGSKQSTPEETVKAAIIAALNVDVDTLITLVDPSVVKEYSMNSVDEGSTLKADLTKIIKVSSEYMKSKGVTSDTIEISDVKYSDDKNTVDVKVNYTDSEVLSELMTLKKIDNKWYLVF